MDFIRPIIWSYRPSGIDEVEIICRVGGEAAQHSMNFVDHVVPLKRGGTAQEVANAILWLLSDEATYTTGGFIDVAGGR